MEWKLIRSVSEVITLVLMNEPIQELNLPQSAHESYVF